MLPPADVTRECDALMHSIMGLLLLQAPYAPSTLQLSRICYKQVDASLACLAIISMDHIVAHSTSQQEYARKMHLWRLAAIDILNNDYT